MILYEYPFNESIRTMLRLEHLFDRLGRLMAREETVDHHYALATMFEIMDVASRADLKSDLLKELDRHRTQLQGFRGNPQISEAALESVIVSIDRAFAALNELPGVSCVMPEGAFYAFPNVRELLDDRIPTSRALADKLLEESAVAVTPGASFGQEGFLRLSYATGLADLHRAVDRIREWIERHNA